MAAKEQKADVRTLLIGLAALRREEAHRRRAEAEALRTRAEHAVQLAEALERQAELTAQVLDFDDAGVRSLMPDVVGRAA